MKKLVLVIVYFTALVLSVNALSIGVGGEFGSRSAHDYYDNNAYKVGRLGFYAFIGGHFLETNLGFKSYTLDYDPVYEFSYNYFYFGLKLKLPLRISERIRIFPLAGVDYSFFTSGKMDGRTFPRGDFRDDTPDFFSFNLGFGTDIFLNKIFFLRGEFNYAFPSSFGVDRDMYNYFIRESMRGPVFKLAIGLKVF